MSVDALREVLKSGPMAEVYARLRQAKRRLRHEPVGGPLLLEDTRLGAEELRSLVALLPDHARLFYSLGLQYIQSNQPEDMPKALACLRSAETLGFESSDRIVLYKALIAAKSGHSEDAQTQILSLVSYELTAEENTLREEVRQNRVQPLAMKPAKAIQETAFAGVKSILVVGDPVSLTASWAAEARYLLADSSVTGLPLQSVAGLGIDFEVAVGPAEMCDLAAAAGIQFSQWRDLC